MSGIEVRVANGLMTGPGVGDDTVAVAALSAVGSLLAGGAGPLWLVGTVGEEGVGNLAGIRHALATLPQPVSAVIAVEGNYLGRVVNVSVGSVRWRVGLQWTGRSCLGAIDRAKRSSRGGCGRRQDFRADGVGGTLQHEHRIDRRR